ncbi:MAG: hypothetical protein R2765_04345 [Ferruginibacter sp.]
MSQISIAQPNKKALFVGDGIPADVVEKVNTPNLDAIAKVGGYTRAHVGGGKRRLFRNTYYFSSRLQQFVNRNWVKNTMYGIMI